MFGHSIIPLYMGYVDVRKQPLEMHNHYDNVVRLLGKHAGQKYTIVINYLISVVHTGSR